MAYLGTKPANQVIDSTLIADGTVTPSDLSTGKPVWDTSGNVGIGTSSPNYKMTVNGGASATAIQLVNTASGTTAGDGLLIYQDGVDSRVQNTEVGNLTLWTGNNERMRIDSSGRVTTPFQPAFQARKTSGANTNPLSPIIFNSEIFDNAGNYNPANGRFTAPVAGVYQFNFSTLVFTVTNYSYTWFSVNGTSTQVSTHSPVTDADYQSHSMSVTLKLAAGDYVEVYFGANGGTPSVENSRTFFSGFLLG